MKVPVPPPDIEQLMKKVQEEDAKKLVSLLTQFFSNQSVAKDPYIPWDKMRHLIPPKGLTTEEWWLATRIARRSVRRTLPLYDKCGKNLSFALPDEVLLAIENINRGASGNISISEQVTNPATRDRYLVSSLMEEAITSSQLEGASTERSVAKDMIRTGRDPKNRSERMILNNYRAMRRVIELAQEELTPKLICELHEIVTEGTLDNSDACGRFQRDDEERVSVQDEYGNILHAPPPANEIPQRMSQLCDFANNAASESYVPPVIRSITVHFMLGYDHPFEDGNGRTARILFYWSMLNQGYWLTEFLTISKILRDAPAKYARSFLYSEQDDNDLTYFHIHHLDIFNRSLKQLHEYLARKMDEVRDFQNSLRSFSGEFNHRQIALLRNGIKNPGQRYTTVSHGSSHAVTNETARHDLLALQKKGLLIRGKLGKAFYWSPAPDIIERLRARR
jgi:Fic family protein